jgi:DNA polymerase
MGNDGLTLHSVLQDLADYLSYEADEGETVVDVRPLTLAELGESRPVAGAGRPAAPAPARTAASPAQPKAQPPAASPAQTAKPEEALQQLAARVAACTMCSLHQTRTRTVPGQGASAPEIMFVGEAPGADEDRQGLAFVGRAGQLLTRMIKAMGFERDDVFIGNILKCRPPNNRAPLPDEMDTCLPYLKEQIQILKPRVIIALGATAVKGLFDVKTGITKLRGNWLTFEGIHVMPTFHPAYLLRNPPAKKEAWEDLKAVLAFLGRTPPPVPKSPGNEAG